MLKCCSHLCLVLLDLSYSESTLGNGHILGSLRSGKLYYIMASLVEEEKIIPLTNSFEVLLDTTEEFLQDHTD